MSCKMDRPSMINAMLKGAPRMLANNMGASSALDNVKQLRARSC